MSTKDWRDSAGDVIFGVAWIVVLLAALLGFAAYISGCGASAVQTQAEGLSSLEVAHARALDHVDAARREALGRAARQGSEALHAERERWRPLARISNALRDAEAAYADALDAQRRTGSPVDPALLRNAEALMADLIQVARSLGVSL